MNGLIYMDNSATSYPKPRRVIRAVKDSLKKCYANPGRSSYKSAVYASNMLFDTRVAISTLVGTVPENIIFTYNATYALNIALFGIIKRGMTVAYDSFAHNSVLRPLYALENNGVNLEQLKTDLLRDSIIISSLEQLVAKKKVNVLVLTHTSNVTGKKLPIKQLSRICKENGIVMIVDASQAIGSCEIDMTKDGIDVLASSGHKGLYGIMGTGFLAFREGFDLNVKPLISGGTGMFSLMKAMPNEFPERLEAGTVGMTGIVSMKAGAEEIMKIGVSEIGEKERQLRTRLVEGLGNIPQIRLYNANVNANSIVLFNFNKRSSTIMADELSKYDVCLRAGYHCAPIIHSKLKGRNQEYDGALRLSVGYFNTFRECEAVISAVNKLCKLNY